MAPGGDADAGHEERREADADAGHEGRPGTDADPDGAEPTPGRARIARGKSAALWGAVGALAFLVLAQGYLLVGGDLPFGYAGLVPVAAIVGLGSGGLAYLTEHRLVAKGRT